MLLPLTAVALFGAGGSLLFNVISVAVPYWELYYESMIIAEYSNHIGLWQRCKVMIVCKDIKEWQVPIRSRSALKATRAMALIAMVVLAGSFMGGVMKLAVFKENPNITKIAGACAIAAGVFMLIAVIVYGTKVKLIKSDLGAGMNMMIMAACGSFVSGGLYIYDKGQRIDYSTFPFKFVTESEQNNEPQSNPL